MRCPSCSSLDTQVKDSRPTEDSSVIRRRRVCLACNFRFTTFERVQLRELTVIKRNGRRVPFDRDKLVRSLQISLRKRPVDPERVEKMVSAIVRELESGGEAEVSSEAIGEIVMEHLRKLDDVAYVRFASVYRGFREATNTRVQLLRAQNDAILIGIGTAMADDPMLTCRLPGMESRSPVRVVLDRALRLSGNSRLTHSARQTPLWLIASETAEVAAATKLGAAGAHVFHLPADDHTPGLDLKAVLHTLSEQGITRLLVEGGAKVASSFLKAGLVNEFWLFQGMKSIGNDGLPALDGQELEAAVASGWHADKTEMFGDDRLTVYRRVGSV